MMLTEYSYVAIAGFVPAPFSAQIVKSSEYLGQHHSSWYVLSERLFPPHLTLWIAYVPSSNIAELSKSLSLLTHTQPVTEITISGVSVEQTGFASVQIRHSENLQALHLSLLKELDQFREGYIPDKYKLSLETYSSAERESILKYGTRFAGDSYKPHISIGFVSTGDSKTAEQYLPHDLIGCKYKLQLLTMFRQKESGRSIEVLSQAECSGPGAVL